MPIAVQAAEQMGDEYQRLPPQAQAGVRQCGYSVERLSYDGDGPAENVAVAP
jgi:hypothetical protein